MDWASVVAMEATYDLGNTQWNLTLLGEHGTPVLFFVDFDHPDAPSPDAFGWDSGLLAPLDLDFAPGGGWQAQPGGRWRAAVRPLRKRELQLAVG
ncbi:hypothetical protein GCM10028798_03470 [Humibacter antri]